MPAVAIIAKIGSSKYEKKIAIIPNAIRYKVIFIIPMPSLKNNQANKRNKIIESIIQYPP